MQFSVIQCIQLTLNYTKVTTNYSKIGTQENAPNDKSMTFYIGQPVADELARRPPSPAPTCRSRRPKTKEKRCFFKGTVFCLSRKIWLRCAAASILVAEQLERLLELGDFSTPRL